MLVINIDVAIYRRVQRPVLLALLVALAASVFSGAGFAKHATPGTRQTAPMQRSPLETHPGLLFNFQTASTLPAGALMLSVGTHQTNPNGPAPGTGNQMYYGGLKYGISERFQLGVSYQYFEDPPGLPINGTYPEVRTRALAFSARLRLIRGQRLSVSSTASIESYAFKSTMFNSRTDHSGEQIVGALHLPFSYRLTPRLQLHLTPGVSYFSSDINGFAFYGTIPSLGVGLSWMPNERFLAYATITAPFGPGGNTISSKQAIIRVPVWGLGARYNVTPKAAVELYLTNGFGATPATYILPLFPDGRQLLFGAKLVYTPGRGAGYRPNYRGISPRPPSPRDRQLELDGFTLASGDTLSPGTLVGTGIFATGGDIGGALFLSPDYDGQVEAMIERYAHDGSVPPSSSAGKVARYMLGAKLRFMDQNNGSPLSLSARALLGRDLNLVGVFYFGLPMTYKLNQRLALMLNPKLSFFGKQRKYGVGFGANYELFKGFQLIAEVTPVSGYERTVWAAGIRYSSAKSPVIVDLHATNAIGRYGLGSMIGQSSVKIALGIVTRFNLKRR